MLLLSKEDIRKVVTMADIIEGNKVAYKSVVDGEVENPLRTVIPGKYDGSFVFMPAYAPGLDAAALKVVDIFPHNPEQGLKTSPAQVLLIDGKTGYISAILDGTYVTEARTGAASGAAFDILGKKECRKGAMIGTGGQAACQLEAMLTARKLEEVAVYSRNKEKREAFAAEMQEELKEFGTRIYAADSADEAVEDADLLITVTGSSEPVFDGTKVKPGCTISCVGTYEPHKHELDQAVLPRTAKIICDSKDAVMAESGDLLIPIREGIISESDVLGSLGDVINGTVAGREKDDEIIVFENVGIAALDLVAAKVIYDKAVEKGIGQSWG